MAVTYRNPLRGAGIPGLGPYPFDDVAPVDALLAQCPAYSPTPQHDLPKLATTLGISRVSVKDERGRMGLGSFKALGAAYAIAREAAHARGDGSWDTALEGRVFVTASAGNHGLSVAAGSRLFGAQAVVFLAEPVPEAFAARLRGIGCDVRRAGATYEQSMAAAEQAAEDMGWTLLSDSSWTGYTALPLRVMEGYLEMAAEVARDIPAPPTHFLLQAGVGGMAAAVAAYARKTWGDAPVIAVIEPEAAPALMQSLQAGRIVTTEGPVSEMGRLDCKTPSMIALAGLARDADLFVTVTEAEAAEAVGVLGAHGLATTPSGAAGLAAAIAGLPDLGADAHVLAILSEGPEDA